jgi:hypothetical protein
MVAHPVRKWPQRARHRPERPSGLLSRATAAPAERRERTEATSRSGTTLRTKTLSPRGRRTQTEIPQRDLRRRSQGTNEDQSISRHPPGARAIVPVCLRTVLPATRVVLESFPLRVSRRHNIKARIAEVTSDGKRLIVKGEDTLGAPPLQGAFFDMKLASRVIEAVEMGASRREAAERFESRLRCRHGLRRVPVSASTYLPVSCTRWPTAEGSGHLGMVLAELVLPYRQRTLRRGGWAPAMHWTAQPRQGLPRPNERVA